FCAYYSFKWHQARANDIFRHYICLLTITFVLFAVSRSVGHLLKQILQLSDLNHVWAAISPFSGAVNTATFVIVASFSLYFNRMQKVHTEIEGYKTGLEKLVEERTRQLAEANLRLETVLESANPICLMNLDFEILRANKAYYDIWPKTAGRGKPLKCFESRPGASCNTPACPINQIAAGKQEVVNQFSKELADGKSGEFIVTARPFRDASGNLAGIVESFQDITTQVNATRELLAEREQLGVTLRSIGDGVITTDIGGTIVLLNKGAEKITGWSQSEVVGRKLDEVFNLPDRDPGVTVENWLKEICYQDSVSGGAPKRLKKKDGSVRLVSENGAFIRNMESEIAGVVLVFRDVTEKSKTEEELSKIKKLESLGILAGGIAHDFNNILTAIMGNISLARLRMESSDERYQLLSSAEKACDRAKNLTHQLLTFAKGGEPIKNLATIKEIIEDSAGFVLRGSNVQCDYVFADDLWNVEVDKGQISQVVQNIILNASAAMAGGGTITVECANHYHHRDTAVLKAGPYVKVSISDRGSGIPGEQLEKIFDPFFTTKKTGSGLGLAITYSIITSHGGHIEVASEPGVGSTFTFYLPASVKTVRADEHKERAEALNAKGSGRIMIMDDDEMIRELVANMLAGFGYEVVAVRDGAEAVCLYREAMAGGEPIAAVIMDLTIPGGMGGKDAAREIHKIDPEARLIVASGYSNDPVMAGYRDYGFSAAMIKPFRLEDLQKVLRQVFS
ncbi:MAG: PAS domain S-box protein, partial [Desulfurivibrionaceae bacterium]|nr:PAS domain S-box protein [Desulfurivibrionaceae bacterium]